MRIEALLASLQQEARLGARLQLDADNSARLGDVKVGDVLQGRVMRDLGQGQWLVRFNQAEVTVQSQTRMTVGDMLKGRVREVGKQVVLERLPQNVVTHGKTSTTSWQALVGTAGYAGLVTQLRQNESESVTRTNHRARQGNKAAAATALMTQLGFGRARDVEMRLSNLLCAYPQEMEFEDLELPGLALQFESTPVVLEDTSIENPSFIGQVSTWLQSLNATENELDGSAFVPISQVLMRLLNVQTLSEWGHSFGVGRIKLDGDLSTLLLAAFDNRSGADGDAHIPFQAASLSCEHPQLGMISFSLVLAKQRLQLAIGVEDEVFAESLRQSLPVLKNALAALDVVLDDCVVGIQAAEGGSWAAESVVDVMLRADALDRRM